MPVIATPKEAFPDVAKLKSMGKRTVFAAKVLGTNRKQTVVNGIGPWSNAGIDQILALQSELPLRHGTGFYEFRVVDDDGPDNVEWTARLGTGPEIPEGSSMPMTGNGAAPGSPEVVHTLGYGVSYNETLGLLTLRDGRLVQWSPGQPLPMEATVGRSAPPVATPVNFGYSPVQAAPESGRGFESWLQMERERSREEGVTRAIADLGKLIVDSNSRFERLVEKLTEKPSGPDPQIELLKQQLEETKRQAAERAAEDRHRAEISAVRDEIKTLASSLSNNRQDPVITLLGTMIQTMQSAQGQAANANKEIAEIMSRQFGGAMMTPERLMEVIRLAKDRGADAVAMQSAIDMYKQLFGMSQEVLRMQAEITQGNQPAWWESALERLGGAAQTVAEHVGRAQQEKATQAEHTRRIQVATMQARQRARASGTIHTPPAPAPASGTVGAAPGSSASPASSATAPQQPKKRGGRRRANGAADLRTVSVEVLAGLMEKYEDPVFFGPFMEAVEEQLRKPFAAGSLSFYDAAKFVLEARQFIAAARQAGQVPPAIELFEAGQYEVLIMRMLPAAPEDFRGQVVESLRAQLQAESASSVSPPDEDEEDADEDGEGEAA
jgi:hypothetical protein